MSLGFTDFRLNVGKFTQSIHKLVREGKHWGCFSYQLVQIFSVVGRDNPSLCPGRGATATAVSYYVHQRLPLTPRGTWTEGLLPISLGRVHMGDNHIIQRVGQNLYSHLVSFHLSLSVLHVTSTTSPPKRGGICISWCSREFQWYITLKKLNHWGD